MSELDRRSPQPGAGGGRPPVAGCRNLMRLAAAVQVDGAWQQAGECGRAGQGPLRTRWAFGPTIRATIRRADGSALRARQIRVELTTALLNYAHVVVPDCGRHYILSRNAFQIRAALYRVSGQNAGFPFFALADEGGRFLLGFGIVSAAGEVKVHRIEPLISTRKALLGGDDRLTQHFQWAGPAKPVTELEVEIFASETDPTWFHALRRFTDAIKRRDKLVYPHNPDAWRPVWCTWPAWVSDRMSDQTVLDNARIAKDLGIGTIILDDGWFGPGLDTEAEALNLGDYQTDASKFKDLPGTIARMQQMGLKVLLWFAACPVARQSQAYQKLRKYVMYQDGQEFTSVNGLAMLCPACPDVRRYVADQVEHLLRTYHCDGFKVDLYNCLPHEMCTSTQHAHDIHDAVAAVEATMAELWQRVRSVKPDALLELKQDYGNARLVRHGTMLRAGDTAYDVDGNTWRCFYAQAYAPVVHNDYLITSRHTEPRAMALMMVRQLAAGVPTFGLDFPTFRPELRDVIKAWLGFYRENLPMFQRPREPQNNDLSAWQGGDGETAWVAALRYCREVTLPQAERIFLINGTSADELYLRVAQRSKVRLTSYDWRLEKLTRRTRTLRDGMRLDVPSAGMVEIRTYSQPLRLK